MEPDRPLHRRRVTGQPLIWLDQRDYDTAIGDFGEAIRLNPSSEPIVIITFITVAREADAGAEFYDSGNPILKPVVGIDVRSKLATAHFERGMVWRGKGHGDRAVEDFDQSIRLDPTKADAYTFRGAVRAARSDYDRAIEDYDQAVRLDPVSTTAYRLRGEAWYAKQDFDRAVRDFDFAVSRERQDIVAALLASRTGRRDDRAFLGRGRAWLAKGDYDQAMRDFDEDLLRNPSRGFSFFSRGRAHSGKEEYSEAVGDFAEAARLDPADPLAFGHCAWLLATCPVALVRDGKRAVRFATKACELDGWKSGDFLTILAAAYAESGQFDEAVRFQRKALEDPVYVAQSGDSSRLLLKLYKAKMPYRATQ